MSKKTQIIELKDGDIDECDNLLLNMMGGLLPEHLSMEEVKLLEIRFGSDWFDVLGYDDNNYVRPRF
jgi:hypothetical protein